MARCTDCGREMLTAVTCTIEQCPVCLQQSISCGCSCGEAAPSHEDDGPSLVDVSVAIEINSDFIRSDPEIDHVFIDPVAICGHVARGHIREMVRGDALPLDEWFDLGTRMSDTAALLFTSRSRDFISVGDDDLDVGRRLAAYTEGKATLPWDFVFVTERGNFRASDLLALPGHPPFEPCTYARRR